MHSCYLQYLIIHFLDYLLFSQANGIGPSNIVEIISYLESKGAIRNYTNEEYKTLKTETL